MKNVKTRKEIINELKKTMKEEKLLSTKFEEEKDEKMKLERKYGEEEMKFKKKSRQDIEDFLNTNWSEKEVKENHYMREKRLTDEELEKKKFANQLNSQMEEDVMGL